MTHVATSGGTNKDKAISFVESVVLICSAIGTALSLGWVFWYSGYGYDFTDESFYLIWISEPFNYKQSVTQFGFIYHPLYELLDGNIASLRRANILITFALAWMMTSCFLKVVLRGARVESTARLVASAAIATASLAILVFSGMWLSTPGYNSLAFQALLLSATGLVLAEKRVSLRSVLGWLLIGLGGWLAFMAKPTTAAAMGLCVLVYLPLAGKFDIRLLAISTATALGLVVASAFAIDGSVIAFVARLRGGLELAGMLNNGNSVDHLIRFGSFSLGAEGRFALLAGTAVLLVAFKALNARSQVTRNAGSAVSICFALASFAMIFELAPKMLQVGQFQALVLCAVPFAAILMAVLKSVAAGVVAISRPQLALGLAFLVMPYAYAFGTNNNYWVLAANAGIFWILGSLVLFYRPTPDQTLVAILPSIGLATQLVVVALIQAGIQTPYRQPQPLRDNDYKLEVGRPGSTLVVSKGFGQSLAGAILVARGSGFTSGTSMLDLTGVSPGILYAIHATSIGQPWTIGGYLGSDNFAEEMLKGVPCEVLASAWLLVEPNGPARISPRVLRGFGADLLTDFAVVGTVNIADGASGYTGDRGQQIVRPMRSFDAALSACALAKVAEK